VENGAKDPSNDWYEMTSRENPFPAPVKSLTDLPESFQVAVDSLEWPEEPVHSILILPAQAYLKRGGVPRQALITTQCGILHVMDGDPPVATYLSADNMLYVRQTLVLLYGGIEFVGEANHQRVKFIVEYNSVGQNFLTATLNRFLGLRYEAVHTSPSAWDQTNYLLSRLEDQSCKFMNGLRLYALQPGEELLGCTFQPRIRKRYFHFITRPLAPASVFAFTSKAVILMEEDKAWGGSHGWVITFCPRDAVLAVESRPVPNGEELRVLMQQGHLTEERNLMFEVKAALESKTLAAGLKAEDRNSVPLRAGCLES
jgi:hypothetical protein